MLHKNIRNWSKAMSAGQEMLVKLEIFTKTRNFLNLVIVIVIITIRDKI
jgi:hypothetical protein